MTSESAQMVVVAAEGGWDYAQVRPCDPTVMIGELVHWDGHEKPLIVTSIMHEIFPDSSRTVIRFGPSKVNTLRLLGTDG